MRISKKHHISSTGNCETQIRKTTVEKNTARWQMSGNTSLCPIVIQNITGQSNANGMQQWSLTTSRHRRS